MQLCRNRQRVLPRGSSEEKPPASRIRDVSAALERTPASATGAGHDTSHAQMSGWSSTGPMVPPTKDFGGMPERFSSASSTSGRGFAARIAEVREASKRTATVTATVPPERASPGSGSTGYPVSRQQMWFLMVSTGPDWASRSRRKLRSNRVLRPVGRGF